MGKSDLTITVKKSGKTFEFFYAWSGEEPHNPILDRELEALCLGPNWNLKNLTSVYQRHGHQVSVVHI